MKKVFFFLLLIGFSSSMAQTFKGLDKSPMDMAYYPHDFAHDRKFAPEKVGDKCFVRVIYSRPAKKDREVFGGMVKYDEVWRVGANEAPEIKFYEDTKIAGKEVKKGTYSLFMIPGKTEWTIILSNDLDVFGAYSYKQSNDVLRVSVPTVASSEVIENFSIKFEKVSDKEAKMVAGWEKVIVEIPMSF